MDLTNIVYRDASRGDEMYKRVPIEVAVAIVAQYIEQLRAAQHHEETVIALAQNMVTHMGWLRDDFDRESVLHYERVSQRAIAEGITTENKTLS